MRNNLYLFHRKFVEHLSSLDIELTLSALRGRFYHTMPYNTISNYTYSVWTAAAHGRPRAVEIAFHTADVPRERQEHHIVSWILYYINIAVIINCILFIDLFIWKPAN